MANDWHWKIGFLHGLGECLWQERGMTKIRRITRPIALPNGQMILQKSLTCIASAEEDPHFDVENMVIEGRDCREDLAGDAERAWNGGVIQPANGPMRFKP